MSEPQTQTRTMKITDVKNQLSGLVNEVYRKETRVVVVKSGIPVAALVPVADLKYLARLDEQRAVRRRMLEAMREPFRGVSPEEIERETAKAVAEVRAEMKAEREQAAKSARFGPRSMSMCSPQVFRWRQEHQPRCSIVGPM